MKFLTITVMMAGVLTVGGCRHACEPAPPPYYCQPASAPACNPCGPGASPYLQPTPTTIPRTIPPYTGTPAAGTYAPPGATYAPPGATYSPPGATYSPPSAGTYATPGANPQPSLPAVR